MQRRKTHELQALEKWLEEMLTEDVLAPQARSEAARKRREDLEQRAKLAQTCLGPLLDQASVASPKLGCLLEKVFANQSKVLHDSLQAYRNQLHCTEDLAERMQKLITFAERQLRRGQFRAELASERAANAQEECDDTTVSMRILREEHAQLRKQANEYASVVQKVIDTGAQELEWSIAAYSDNALDDALGNLEQEQRRKLKSLRDLDRLVAKLELDELTAVDRGYRRAVSTKDAETMIEGNHTYCILEELSLARGRVSQASKDLDPPLIIPRRWRAGWNIPFPIRENMTTFQVNKRILPLPVVRKHIFTIYASRNITNNTNGNKPNKSSSRTAAPSGTLIPPTIYALLHQYFSNLYGLEKLTDWHLFELLNSMENHRADPRVAVFGYLMTAIRPRDFRRMPCRIQQASMSGKVPMLSPVSTKKLKRHRSHKNMSKKELAEQSFDRDELPAVRFLFALLDRIAESGEAGVGALQAPDDSRAAIPRSLILQIVQNHTLDWHLVNSSEIVRIVGSLELIHPPSSTPGKSGKSKVSAGTVDPLAATPSKPSKSVSVTPPTISSNKDQNGNTTAAEPDVLSPPSAGTTRNGINNEREPSHIDLDEAIMVTMQGWAAHEAAWRDRLLEVYLTYCKVMRFNFGQVQTCTTITKNGLDEKRDVLLSNDAEDNGYFSVMDLEGFRGSLRSLGVTANKRQVSNLFSSARTALATRRKVRSDAVWTRATSVRPEDKGRTYFINQITNERVWDDQPLFDTELDEVMSANSDIEIDSDSFIRTAIQNKWDKID